ncbi:rRNA maturation RNase YbeY [Pelotomaculum sp. PtaB.Bin117]|uniref:rRNA maturation RNase YbeY n=1 Tax=Pelotomaculum sp. PtaB.Bin117 TaxID=1811694 RepID=UPI0009D1CE97|nr:rRNA maturation RNase YbeY [Pelotomaculum sp. PtaB.Bin117]OPX87072.1 MAG: Endoribonuclease YbeY [Pelotomaculum sp. PtaB.Bin117]
MPVFVSNQQEEVALDNHLADYLVLVVQEALKDCGYGDDAEVSLVLVNDSYIRDLNLQYRGIDSPTDVLSFAMQEGEVLQGGEAMLGDLVISLPTARRQAEEYGHSFQREVAYLTIHGVLHLLGYDHQQEDERRIMRQKEEELLVRLNLFR